MRLASVCPCCKKDARLYLTTTDRNLRLSQECFHYYRCKPCGLIFLSPIPANLADYYPSTYYSGCPTMEELRDRAQLEQYKVDLVKRFVPEGRLLEIGPAYGTFAYCAKTAGFEVEAIELNEDCCRFLNDVVGIKAICEPDVTAALRQEKPYNAIVLWHVLEHLPEPWKTLEAVTQALVPGGIVVIASPNTEAFQFRIFRRFWAHIDAPRHTQLIPRKLIQREMEALGFKTLLSTTKDEGSLEYNRFGWAYSLCNFVVHPQLGHYLRRAGAYIDGMLNRLERREGHGSAYTIILEKPGLSH
jgi:2-polyprenyl-3-methyl-5-hydroxy-6-metoxy-1,4-benzoquinol methylase